MFSPKIINNEYYIDAFAVNNCPCNIFKNDLENTICLNMANEAEYTNINSFQSYIMNVFDSIRNYSQNVELYKPKILINLSYNCSPIDFDLSKDIMSDIFITGYNTTNLYFKNNPIQEEENTQEENKQEENKKEENTQEKDI